MYEKQFDEPEELAAFKTYLARVEPIEALWALQEVQAHVFECQTEQQLKQALGDMKAAPEGSAAHRGAIKRLAALVRQARLGVSIEGDDTCQK